MSRFWKIAGIATLVVVLQLPGEQSVPVAMPYNNACRPTGEVRARLIIWYT